jgi:uncharacterized protein (TIGR04255 family)
MPDPSTTRPNVPDRRYRRPPLVEAFCEIYFSGSEWDSTIPGLFYERVRHQFPDKSAAEQLTVELQFPPAKAQILPEQPRIIFARTDKTRLIQLTRDLLVVNQLRPYTSFEDWREIVLATVGIYRELARPTGFNRLGVRYVNRIEIPVRPTEWPKPPMRMEDYFRVYPEVPVELGRSHGPFMLQMMLMPAIEPHQLTLSLGFQPSGRPDLFTFMLDLYAVAPLAADERAADRLAEYLDAAHTNVVYLFENSITDATRNLFGD